MSISHLRKCCARSINSSDLLIEDVLRDSTPNDPQVRDHFGFDRCRNRHEESLLLGLYQGLIKMLEVSYKELDEWQEQGRLVDEITAHFEAIPYGNRGEYYPWFLKNKDHIFPPHGSVPPSLKDSPVDVLEVLEKYRGCLPSEDQKANLTQLKPATKNICFFFFALLMERWTPIPNTPLSADLWYELGFVTCQGPYEEMRLAAMYLHLLDVNRPMRLNYTSKATRSNCSFD